MDVNMALIPARAPVPSPQLNPAIICWIVGRLDMGSNLKNANHIFGRANEVLSMATLRFWILLEKSLLDYLPPERNVQKCC